MTESGQKSIIAFMTPQDIIQIIDDYAAATGLSRSTICERATGNTRLYDRLVRRGERDAEDAKRLQAFIAANPPQAAQ